LHAIKPIAMKYAYPLCLVIAFSLLIAGCKKDDSANLNKSKPAVIVYKAPANFRVVGYLQDWEIQAGQSNDFDMTRLNYLNIDFEAMTASGQGLPDFTNLDATIAAAHKAKVVVLGTVGASLDLSFLTAAKRTDFIDSLMASVGVLHLDGLDIDLEGDNINSDYEGFVGDLSVALKAKGKILTAAVATWERASFTDKSLTYFDYVNVMSYDKTGPWDPSDPGPDSPYEMVTYDFNYWSNTRGITPSKINVGVPFYGYGFGAGVKENYNYVQIVNQFPGSENKDHITVAAGGTVYYNGIPTIQKKTTFAMQNAGGVMIWEIMADAKGKKSLLNAINETANPDNN